MGLHLAALYAHQKWISWPKFSMQMKTFFTCTKKIVKIPVLGMVDDVLSVAKYSF